MKSYPLQIIGRSAIAVTLACLAVACHEEDEPRPSNHVSTDQTYAYFSVTARATGPVYAHAQLREGGAAGTSLRLEGGDMLWFSAGQSVDAFESTGSIADALAEASENIARMDERGTTEFDFLFVEFAIIGTPYYIATVNPVSEGRYYLGYLRQEMVNATDSFVTLPSAFDIIAPLPSETVSRTNDIVVNWETSVESVDEVDINAALVCDNIIRQSFRDTMGNDPGTYTIPGGTLDETTNQICQMDIEITKRRFGELETGFNGGEINGQRVTTVTVMSID
ncbi:MAG TPA: hypothetical protein VF268_01350 [Gammaproteobacteria bacterium]